MTPFLTGSYDGNGAVVFSFADPLTVNGCQGYDNLPCVALGTASSDVRSGAARYTEAGKLRIYDATAGVPAGAVIVDGVAFTTDGELCITTETPSSPAYIGLMAVRADGAVYSGVSFAYNFLGGFIDPVLGGGTTTVTVDADGTYTDSTGTIVQATANTARFDYDPVTLAPRGLLIEPTATNLLLQSADFGTTWTPTAATIDTDATTSPDGTANADKLEENNTIAAHFVSQTLTKAASAIAYTSTFYVKAAERSWVVIAVRDAAANGNRFWFDIGTGAVGSITVTGLGFTSTSSSISAAGNGWYRCALSYTSTTGTSLIHDVCTSTGNAVISYQGVTGSGIYVWGAQCEAGIAATSYIPTTTVAVARTIDNCNIALGAWFNATEGTFVCRYMIAGRQAILQNVYFVSDGTNNNRITHAVGPSGDTATYFVVVTGGATQVASTRAAAGVLTQIKTAFSYKLNDFAFAKDGGAVGTDTAGTIPTVTTMYLGTGNGTGNALGGWLQSIEYYPTRRSNTTVVALS